MKITIQLSTESIERAISELGRIRDNIEDGLKQTIEMLTKEGALIAQAADGEMATVTGTTDGLTGTIEASGEAPIIAEFGAGDATLIPEMFENLPNTPVYPGSFSESEEGSGMYAALGWWKFGGRVYTEVEPRQGLYQAKQHIIENATQMAMEVIEL